MQARIRAFGFGQKKIKGAKVLVLIDWENLLAALRLLSSPPERFSMAAGFDRLIEEITDKVGEIAVVFIFTPSHLVASVEQISRELGFFTVVCPKTKDKKTGEYVDTVDATLIELGEIQMGLINGLTHLCIGSGDRDFTPLMRRARRKGLRTIVVAGSEKSLASKMIDLADNLFIFSPSID